jgi:putative sigma-54 modulation protein
MQIAVTFRHREPEEGVKDYVREKVEKLEKYLGNPREIHVVLSSEKFRQMAEITILSNGVTLNSEGKGGDLYAAIDQMVEKIERQVRERRGKGRPKRGNPASLLSPEGEKGSSEEGEEIASLIRKRRTIVKPMSVEEAASQMNLLQQDFFIFINSESGQVNVLSRRKDGGYEWIEPSLK